MLRTTCAATKHRGQALVEFAIIAPLLFLLLFGVIQLGLLFGAQNGLVNSVRDAARRAATYRVNDESLADPAILSAVCSAVGDELQSQLSRSVLGYDSVRLHPTPPSTSILSYHWEANPGSDTAADRYFLYVEVSVSYDHPLYVPLVGNLLDAFDGNTDGALTLTASEQMRVENPSMAEGTAPPPCT